jgi:hypothetical protein
MRIGRFEPASAISRRNTTDVIAPNESGSRKNRVT